MVRHSVEIGPLVDHEGRRLAEDELETLWVQCRLPCLHRYLDFSYPFFDYRCDELGWLPAIFDQRHNFVALISLALPRNFRFGVRFRLGSGNPETPVTGREVVPLPEGGTGYRPLHAVRGTSYQPLYHQLDLRLDKSWVLDRTTVGAYLDVQNIYNHLYPEIWIYSADWSARQQAFGLPIYPSLGVSVSY